MKRAGIMLTALVMFRLFVNAQTGADCANAIPLVLDGVCRTFATSASTGASLHCVDNLGNAPITYFSFTTNSVPDKVLLNITGPSGQPVEVAVYPNSCSFMYSSNNICFDDGDGLWSFSHVFTPVANTTYKLRIRTNVAGNIVICAQNFNPPNDVCSGALILSPDTLTDNNANETAGPGVSASDLCASTLENTAFYKFTVASTGPVIINLNNIKCDNSYGSNSNGFQIGVFSGSCGSLTPITCYAGSGSFVSTTTATLSAGTDIFVAIDGTAGSNCSYKINAINSMLLAAKIKNFSGWKKGDINLLNWTVLDETGNTLYEIQRSNNRKDFYTIGQLRSSSVSQNETLYKFEDKNPAPLAYYRIKFIEPTKKASYSKIVFLKRDLNPLNSVEVINPVVGGMLTIKVFSETKAEYNMSILNTLGQVVMTDKLNCNNELFTYQKSVSFLPSGVYHIVINNPGFQIVKPFVKN